jgi:hypothetical protein
VGGVGLGVGLAPGVRDAGEDAPAIVIADLPGGVAVVLEALDQAGKSALAQMDLLPELLDATMSFGRLGEAAKNLVLSEGEAVFSLQTMLEGLTDTGVLGLELVPPI